MEFCSKLGYNYGFEGSDEEEIEQKDPITKLITKKKVRKSDTNILSIKVDKLVEYNKLEKEKNKLIECKNCQAFISYLNKVIKENQQTKWKCEFCFEENLIDFDFDQITEDDITYLIEPAVKKIEINHTSEEVVSLDDNFFTLCLDVSGSMGTTLKESVSLFSSNLSSITRLDAIKSACIENLKKLKTEEPNKRVSLVTFGNEIYYYGDCINLKDESALIAISESNHIFGGFGFGSPSNNQFAAYRPKLFTQYSDDIEMKSQDDTEELEETLENLLKKENLLSSIEDIRKIANLTDKNLNGISKSYEKLEIMIKKLFASGGTALGPALFYSICLSESVGSQICLLTDGAANIGLGSLYDNNNNLGEKFYEEAAQYSKEKGITINVITVEGTDCRLAILGKLANVTNGNLNIVNPLNLGDELKSILENRIKATNVKVKLIVNHKYIYIRDDELNKLETQNDCDKLKLEQFKKSVLVKEIGSAKNDSETFFEYGIRRVKNENKSVISEMPFQIQIEYTRPDGEKLKRVLTKVQKFSTNRDEVEKNISSTKVIFASSTQKMAVQALNNNVVGTNLFSIATTNMANRLNLAQPTGFIQASTAFGSMNPNQSFGFTNDQDANNVYKFSKFSSSSMN